MTDNVKKPTKKLNPKQEAFVREYLIDLNATEAAKRAGYSEKTAYSTGHELLKKPEIFRLISQQQAARQERTEITADYVLFGIVDTIERCRQAKPVTDKKGNPIYEETPDGQLAPVYKFDATNALKGYELLGKHLALFTDKLKLDGELSINPIASLFEELHKKD